MARTPEVLEDPTPLDSPHLDVRVRVAWLLRISRDGAQLSVTEMAHRLKEYGIAASAPSVSGWETGRVAPSASVLEAYEAVLGRDPGLLRGAVDDIRRTHGQERPRIVAPTPRLADLDRAAEKVLGNPEATGLDWLHFSEAALAVRPGLPARLLRPSLDRLLSEVSRAVYTAYVTRYEALALLRCGQYGATVLEAVHDYLREPGNQVVTEAMGVAAERADMPGLRLLVGHLADADPALVRGAVLGIENLVDIGGLTTADWDRAVEPFVSAFNAAKDDEGRRLLLTRLWHALPCSVRAAAEPALARPVEPPAVCASSPEAHGRDLAFCRRLADAVCDAAGIRPQPLLARLVFEAAFDGRPSRNWSAVLLLMATPLRSALATELAHAAQHHGDRTIRDAARELLLRLGHPAATPYLAEWLDGDSPDLAASALVELAHIGGGLADERLRALLDAPDPIGRRALYYAGMRRHPTLRPLAADATHRLAQGARWWRRHGGIVTA